MERHLSSVFPTVFLILLISSGTVLAQYNGEIVAWGRNNYGQCNVPSPNECFIVTAIETQTQLQLWQIFALTAASSLSMDIIAYPSVLSGASSIMYAASAIVAATSPV